MTILRLEALRSDDTLGFLAALGTVELCRSALRFNVRLGWDGIGGGALLDVPVDTTEQLSEALLSAARSLSEGARLVPASDPVMVPKAMNTNERRALGDKVALDPLKMHLDAALLRFQQVQDLELADPGTPNAGWITSLVNQLAAARPRESDERRLSPLYAASGQMTVHQLLRDTLDDVLKRPSRLHEALAGWRREPGTGANLDSRALVDGAAASAGEAGNRAVLGATWLALQAIPWFTQVGNGREGDALLWVRDRNSSTLVWPVWRQLLDPVAMRALFHQRTCRLVPTRNAGRLFELTSIDLARARALGVEAVFQARRRPLGKSAGPLRDPAEVWRSA